MVNNVPLEYARLNTVHLTSAFSWSALCGVCFSSCVVQLIVYVVFFFIRIIILLLPGIPLTILIFWGHQMNKGAFNKQEETVVSWRLNLDEKSYPQDMNVKQSCQPHGQIPDWWAACCNIGLGDDCRLWKLTLLQKSVGLPENVCIVQYLE